MQSQAQKQFINLLSKIDFSKRMYEVFNDFCTLGCYSLALPFYPEIAKQELKPVHDRYTKEQLVKMDEAFTLMVNEMETGNGDFLGEVYQQCELGSDKLGQFFTPFPVSEMIARISAGSLKEEIEAKHFITVNDPACGSGGMLIAFRKAMIDQQCNPSRDAFFVGQDISDAAFKMCYIQLSLYGVGGKVIHGNTITMEIWRELYTPVYFLTDWQIRMSLRSLSELFQSQPVRPEPVLSPASFTPSDNEQLNLFA